MKKYSNKGVIKINSTKSSFMRVVLSITTIFIISLTMVKLDKYYLELQYSIFNPDNGLIFIYSNLHNIISVILLVLLVAIIYIYLWRVKLFIRSNLKLKRLATVIVVVFLLIITFIFDIYKYSYIKNDGIYIRNSIFDEVKFYPWNNVKDITIGYHLGRGKNTNKAYIDYHINLDNGTKVNVMLSKEIWGKIHLLDKVFSDKGVVYKKQEIDSNIYEKLLKNYKSIIGSNTEDILKKLYSY